MIPIATAARNEAPKGLRLHIGLFGKRNAGKSSLINALTCQEIALVSDVAGTTTDPVEKPYELQPVGPVVLIDTAGIDDVGELGQLRVKRTYSLLDWMDIALIVCAEGKLNREEIELIARSKENKIPFIVIFNKKDLANPDAATLASLKEKNIPFTLTSVNDKASIDQLRVAIASLVKDKGEDTPSMVGYLVHPGDTVFLVTPIDTGAPKGRLIMPQVQAIREILDADAKCLIVRENRLKDALANEKTPPRFVLTDSQVVARVAKILPEAIPLTTFSIQMAQSKSDLVEMARGAAAIKKLKPGDKVMVCETCSHHPQADDIGRVKIPRWLEQKIGGHVHVDIVVGKDFPADLTPYKLILQCGGCVVTRRHMLARARAARAQGVPMTNYGLAISDLQGVLERVLALHPDAYRAYKEAL